MTNTKNLFSLFLFAFAVSFSSISFSCPSCELDEPKKIDEAKSVKVQEEKEEVKETVKTEAKADVVETVVPVKKENTVLAKNDAPEALAETEVKESDDSDSDDDDDDFEFDEEDFKEKLAAFAEMFKDVEEPANNTNKLTA